MFVLCNGDEILHMLYNTFYNILRRVSTCLYYVKTYQNYDAFSRP